MFYIAIAESRWEKGKKAGVEINLVDRATQRANGPTILISPRQTPSSLTPSVKTTISINRKRVSKLNSSSIRLRKRRFLQDRDAGLKAEGITMVNRRERLIDCSIIRKFDKNTDRMILHTFGFYTPELWKKKKHSNSTPRPISFLNFQHVASMDNFELLA